MYFLGIAGGAQSRVIVTDEYFHRIIGFTGGSVDYYTAGLENARRNLKEAVDIIADETGIMRFDAAFIGIPSLYFAAPENELAALAGGILPADRTGLNSELFVTLKATGEKPAALCICGSGSMAAGLTEKNEIITRGGFGWLLGDEGGAYITALEAMREAVRAGENIGDKTGLTKALLSFYSLKSIYELPGAFYNPPKTRREIAAFAAEVTGLARDGDASAAYILKTQAELLSQTVRSLLSELPEGTPLYCRGGVFKNDEIFTGFFKRAVSPYCGGCFQLQREPVWGAVIAASEL